MIAALEGHGLTHQEGTTSSAQQSHQEKATAAQIRKAAQQRKAKDYLNVLEALGQEEAPLGKVESELKTNAHNLTATEKTAYKRFGRLAGVCTDQAAIIEQLKEIGPKRAKFEVLLKRIKIEALKRDKD